MMSSRIMIMGLLVAAGGCIEREGRPVNPCTQVNLIGRIQVDTVDKVDLLFMVDNSNSMADEQASLADEFPLMINILASGDFNQDGDNLDEDDFDPVRDLNVGIITSDMGVGGHTGVPTCGRADYGDDGVLRTQGRVDLAGCSATYPSILRFQTDTSVTPDAFARDVACVATVGTGGCGFEQQLEAVLKAVTPSSRELWTSPTFVPVGTSGAPRGLDRPFFGMSTPHGGGTGLNAGFARENAVLAIIPVTDEEDCSALDPDLFNPSSPTYGVTDLNLRCFAHGSRALHPVERYTNGLIQLRTRPNLLVYAPIVGIPVDLVPEPRAEPDWARLVSPDPAIRDERMVERIDPTTPNRLVPSCNVERRGLAFPPVRIVQVAEQLGAAGAGVTVQSICQESFRDALLEIIRQIQDALSAACLPRALNVQADGSVSCDVLARMPGDAPCYEGSTPKRDESGNPITENGRAICVIPQLVPSSAERAAPRDPEGTGWFYDNYTGPGAESCQNGDAPFQRIAFAGVQPPSGSDVRLECFLAVQGSGGSDIQIGTFCDPDAPDRTADNRCANGSMLEGATLSCDPIARYCGVPCTDDSACRAAGLIGFSCDTRPRSAVDRDFAGDDTPHGFCVNPTCG